MQVEELTAQLGLTGLAQFLTGLREADVQVQATTRQLKELTAAAVAARAALEGVKIDKGAVAESTAAVGGLKRELAGLDESAKTTKACIQDVKMSTAQVEDTAANASRQKESLRGIRDEAEVAKIAIEDVDIGIAQTASFTASSDVLVRDLDKVRDHALEAAAALRLSRIGGGGPITSMTGRYGVPGDESGMGRVAALDVAEQHNAAALSGIKNQAIRHAYYSAEAQRWFAEMTSPSSPAGGFGGGADTRVFAQAERSVAEARRIERTLSGGGGGGGGGIFGLGTPGDGHHGGGGVNRGALFGLLPGGSRGSQAAVTTLLGLAGGAAVGMGPGAVGLGVAAGAGITTLAGALGTLKLAFADITAAAFTQKAAFDKLTPVQKDFVQSLRSLDAGLVKGLEHTAQATVLPGLTSALHLAFTPALAGQLNRGVGAMGGAISGGAQQFGRMLGGHGMPMQIGTMMKQDAGYLRDFLNMLTHLTSAFVRLNVSAGPFLHWLSRAGVAMSKWADQSIRADQANGRLVHFFNMAKESLRAVGGLLLSVGHLAGGFAAALGFQNAIRLINLLKAAINGVAQILRANAPVTRAFFAGALGAAENFLAVIRVLSSVLRPILATINALIGGTRGWRIAIQTLSAIYISRMLLMRLATLELRTVLIGLSAAIPELAILTAILLIATHWKQLARMMPIAWKAAWDAIKGILDFAVYGILLQYKLIVDGLDKAFGWVPIIGDKLKGVTKEFNGWVDGFRARGEKQFLNAGSLAGQAWSAGFSGTAKAGLGMVGPIGARDGPGMFGTTGTIGHRKAANPFADPGAMAATAKTDVLPIGLSNAILDAQASGDVAAERRAINAGIAWITGHIGAVKNPTVHGMYRQEQISLQGQLQSLSSAAASTARSAYSQHIANISSGLSARQAKLSAARVALAGTVSGTPAQEAHGARVAIEFAHTQMAELQALKEKLSHEKQTSRMKVEEARVQREMNYVQSLLHQAQKDQLMAVRRSIQVQLSQHSAAIRTAFGTFQGAIGAGATGQQEINASNTFLAFAAHQMEFLHLLKKDAKNAQDRARIQREITTLSGEIDKADNEHLKGLRDRADEKKISAAERVLGIAGNLPHGAVAAQHETTQTRHLLNTLLGRSGLHTTGSLQGDIQILYKNHDISKKTYESLEKILKEITIIKGINGQVPSILTGNVTQRLTQIRDNTQAAHAHPTTFHVPSIAEMTRGLTGGTAQQRKIIADRLAEAQIFGGKIPTGTDVFGYPTSGGHAAAASKPSSQVTIHGGVHIHVSGVSGNAAQIAKQIREELLKTGRRNPTQTRGPVAGRKLGLA